MTIVYKNIFIIFINLYFQLLFFLPKTITKIYKLTQKFEMCSTFCLHCTQIGQSCQNCYIIYFGFGYDKFKSKSCIKLECKIYSES